MDGPTPRQDTFWIISSSKGIAIGKLRAPQLVKKFFTFCRTRRLIIIFTTACRLWVRRIQLRFFKIHFNISSIYTWLLETVSPILIFRANSWRNLSFPVRATWSTHLIVPVLITLITHDVDTNHDTFCCRISSNLLRPPLAYAQVSSSAPYSGTFWAYVPPIQVTDQVSHPYEATDKIVFCIFSSLRLYRALSCIFLAEKLHILSKPLLPPDSARLPVVRFCKIVCLKLIFVCCKTEYSPLF